jgi:hypothetical protein
MKNRFFPLVCGAFLLLPHGLAHGQDSTATLKDAEFGRWIGEGRGIIFVESNIIQETNLECPKVEMFFRRPEDTKPWYLEARLVSFLDAIFGRTLGGIGALPSGTYALTSITCSVGNNHHVLLGPHAKLQIRAGEIVNIGMFKMTMRKEHEVNILNPFDKNPTLNHRSIEPLSAQGIAYFKETTPYTFARAVTRPMILLGSPDGVLSPCRGILLLGQHC